MGCNRECFNGAATPGVRVPDHSKTSERSWPVPLNSGEESEIGTVPT